MIVKHAGVSKLPPGQLEFLSAAIRPGDSVLEIGTFHGVTAALLAAAHPDVHVLSVDVFSRPWLKSAFNRNSPDNWLRNRRPNQNLFVGTAQELAAICRVEKFNVILVDADHAYEACRADLATVRRLLAVGGRLFAHDYGDPERWQGVTRAVDEFCAEHGWAIIARSGTLVELRR